MKKEELIGLLNKDLALEYSSAIQYIQHSSVMTGAEFSEVIEELKKHAGEEMQHAEIISEQIDLLRGEPTVEVGEIKTSRDNREMLEQDLAGEDDAVQRYTERIKQAEELGESALAQHLRNILLMEQEHVMDLKKALGR